MKLIKLKTLVFPFAMLVSVLSIISCSSDNVSKSELEINHMARFEESVVLKTLRPVNEKSITGKNLSSSESYSAFKIENYDKEFILRNVYVVDGVDYVDTGDFNDQVKGDGIYTSLKPNDNVSSKEISVNKIIKSDKFKFTNKFLANKAAGGEIGCKMRMVYGGAKSWFGNSCDGGCIELYDCSFKLSW
jgi:hypothetical protein